MFIVLSKYIHTQSSPMVYRSHATISTRLLMAPHSHLKPQNPKHYFWGFLLRAWGSGFWLRMK